MRPNRADLYRLAAPGGPVILCLVRPAGGGRSCQTRAHRFSLAMNRWNIPDWLEREVVERDRNYVYCGVSFASSSAPSRRRARPSWEHIVNGARLVTRQNIALCCIGCNASKGAKDLTAWLEFKYCRSRGITELTVASVVQATLAQSLAYGV
jgi:hypothetical protein